MARFCQTEPLRRSSVHTSSMHGGVAPFATLRLPCQRDQRARQPRKPNFAKMSHNGKRQLFDVRWLVLLLNGYIILKESLLLGRLTLAIFSSIFVGQMCMFVSRPMKIVTFLRKNDYTQNGLLIFFGKETHSETKSWKSSRILIKKVAITTVNPGNRRGFCV